LSQLQTPATAGEGLEPSPVYGQLWPHQLQAQPLLLGGSALLWWEPRLGKTAACLAAFEQLRQARPRPAVVVCPQIAKAVWRKEAERMGLGVEVLTLHGLTQRRIDRRPGDGRGRLVLVNWELARSWLDELRELVGGGVLILDETHDHITNPLTARHRAAYSLSIVAERTWISTGTPYRKSALDLFWQLRMLGPRANPFQIWSDRRFGNRYCDRVPGYWPGQVEYRGLKDGREQELLSRVPAIDKRRVEDVPYVPLRVTSWVSEGPMYEHDNDNGLAAALAALAELKARRTVEYVRSLPRRPVVVFGWHRRFIELVAGELQAPIVYGGTSADQREQAIAAFSTGQVPVLVCNLRAAGMSIDLARAADAVVGELWWDEVTHRQAEARILGPRQLARHPTIHYLMSADSADEHVWNVRLGKGRALDRLDEAATRLQAQEVS
jgi:hypothetical protein